MHKASILNTNTIYKYKAVLYNSNAVEMTIIE